jgi:exonuclease SbcC
MVPVESELAKLRATLNAQQTDWTGLTARIVELEGEVARLPVSVTAAAADVEAARAAEPALAQAQTLVASLTARHAAVRRAADLTVEIAGARDELRSAIDTHQARQRDWLDLSEQRINGMAAEIATALAVGDNCPVCGSSDHPHPASPAPGAPTSAEEKVAQKRVDTAAAIREAHEDRVRGLDTMLAVAREQAGDVDASSLPGELSAARAAAAELTTVAAGLDAARTRHDRARADLQRAEAALGSARVDLGSLDTSLAATHDRIHRLCEALDETLAGRPDLGSAIHAREETAALLASVLDASRARDAAAAHLAEVTADLGRVALECGFDDAPSAVAALLPVAQLTALEGAVAAHDNALLAARAVHDDAGLAAAATRPAPDLTALAQAQARAAEALATAEATHSTARETSGRIEALRTQLLDSLAAWAPVREAHELAAQVAGFAEGKAADNRAQMRLSAYVLSWRLGQVVDAANVRLSRMTDQRYALEHTALKGAGETRGGLSLLVRDEWSGEARDPVTLSGGETFVVSLALALGLTDVVTQEAGGADVGTLFVDEGFGSLDADTLDDVMDTLDSLREGGRVVGIVSHVPELRTRIPTQLRVDKARGGSSLQLVRASA